MKFFRIDQDALEPLPGGVHAAYQSVEFEDRLQVMVVDLERKGDTGKRRLDDDVLLIVIHGSGQVRSGVSVAEVRAGDVILIEAGEEHTIWTSDDSMRIILQSLE